MYRLFILFLAVISVCSCQETEKRLLWEEIDSLSETTPSKALEKLRQAKGEMEDASYGDRMKWILLKHKIEDKSYISQTSDSDIVAAVDYFEEYGTGIERIEAYYYAASTYRDLNNGPQAIAFFLKVLQDGESKSHIKLLSNTYFQMGLLFNKQHLYQEAVNMFMHAYAADKEMNDTSNMAHSLKKIAFSYACDNKDDSSFVYYNRALRLVEASGDTVARNMIRSQMADLLISREEYSKALDFLKPIMYEKPLDRNAYYSMTAKAYMGAGNADSAKFYCEKLLAHGNVYSKRLACKILLQCHIRDNDHRKILSLLSLYEACCDSIDRITATESVMQMKASYDYQIREKENTRLKIERSRFIAGLFVVSTISCLLLFAVYFLSVKYRQKRMKMEQQMALLKKLERENYERSEDFIKENRRKISSLEEELKHANRENGKLLNTLKEQREELVFANQKAMREAERKENAMYQLSVSKSLAIITDKIEKEKPLSVSEWESIDEEINIHFADFKNTLYAIHPLSMLEYHICVLVKCGIKTSESSLLLCKSVSAVSLAKKRLYKKLFKKEGSAKDLDTFLYGL